MSTRTESPTTRPAVDGVKGARILIVESRFYADIADALNAGAEREIAKNGATADRVVVPGAFEIPGAIALAAGRYDGYVALGCVIRGETSHYDYVCGESARGLMEEGDIYRARSIIGSELSAASRDGPRLGAD